MNARYIVIAALLLVCPVAGANIPSRQDAQRLETEIADALARKIPKFSEAQRKSFAAALRRHIENHRATFDAPLISKFVAEYAKADPFVVVSANRPRTNEEYALELAVTKKKVDLFLEKTRLSETDKRAVTGQIKTLSDFAEANLKKWLAGLDAVEFRSLHADLRAEGKDPLTELIGFQKFALEKTAASPFHYAFRRPLTAEELQRVKAKWQSLVEKHLAEYNLPQRIPQWRQRLAEVARISDRAERQQHQQRIFNEVQGMTSPARIAIAAAVKGVMEMPPTEEEKRASEAYRKRLREGL